MRVLLDECVPIKIKRLLVDHDVRTMRDARLLGLKDSELFQPDALVSFDVLLTTDAKLVHEQRVDLSSLMVIVMRTYRTSFEHLAPLVPHVLELLHDVRPGTWVEIGPLAK